MQQPVQTTKKRNCGSSAVSSTTALENWTCTANVDHRINVLQLENLCGKRTRGICNCATKGMSTNLSKEFDELQLWDIDCLLRAAHEFAGPAQQTSITLSMNCNCEISMVRRTMGTSRPARENLDVCTTGTSSTVSTNLGNSMVRQMSGSWEKASAPRREDERPVKLQPGNLHGLLEQQRPWESASAPP